MVPIFYERDKEVTNTEIGTKSRIVAVKILSMLRFFCRVGCKTLELRTRKVLDAAGRTLVGRSSRSLENNGAESNVALEVELMRFRTE